MKYTRGAYLKWTKKALNPRTQGSAQRKPEDRMVVLLSDEVMFVRNGIVEQMDMYKTQDSYVEFAGTCPEGLQVESAEVRRVRGERIINEFKMVVV